MHSFDLDAFLPYQLALLASRVSRDFATTYKERFGINVAQWRVIAHLSQTQEAVSVREICARVELEKSKVSRAVSNLQSRGLVAKQTHPDDRRLVELTLTAKGHEMVAELAELAVTYEQELLRRLPNGGRSLRGELLTLLDITA